MRHSILLLLLFCVFFIATFSVVNAAGSGDEEDDDSIMEMVKEGGGENDEEIEKICKGMEKAEEEIEDANGAKKTKIGEKLDNFWLLKEKWAEQKAAEKKQKIEKTKEQKNDEDKEKAKKFANKRELIEHGLKKMFCRKVSASKTQLGEEYFETYEPEWSTKDGSSGLQVYAEELFDWLVKHYGQNNREMLLSLAKPLVTMDQKGGNSGSSKFWSADRKFVVKKMEPYDVRGLEQLVLGYRQHMQKYGKNTFLPRLYGVIRPIQRVKPLEGEEKVRSENNPFWRETNAYVIMENVLFKADPTGASNDLLEFDIKGTFSPGSAVQPNKKVFREFNFLGTEENMLFATERFPKPLVMEALFPEGILLSPQQHKEVMERLSRDIELLSSKGINDYSLLLAARFVNGEPNQQESSSTSGGTNPPIVNGIEGIPAMCNRCRPSYSTGDGAQRRDNAHLLVFVSLIDMITPFDEEREKLYIRQLKRFRGIDLGTDMGKNLSPDQWEHVSPIPSAEYKRRFLGVVSGCIFRQNFSASYAPTKQWIEAVRQGLVQTICMEFGKSRKVKETVNWSWLDDPVRRDVSVAVDKKYTLSSFGFGLFKALMDLTWKTPSWELLISLANGKLLEEEYEHEQGQKQKESIGTDEIVLTSEDKEFHIKSLKKEQLEYFRANLFKYYSDQLIKPAGHSTPRYYAIFQLKDNAYNPLMKKGMLEKAKKEKGIEDENEVLSKIQQMGGKPYFYVIPAKDDDASAGEENKPKTTGEENTRKRKDHGGQQAEGHGHADKKRPNSANANIGKSDMNRREQGEIGQQREHGQQTDKKKRRNSV